VSYRDYVIAAYGVFAVVMLWDFLAPHLAIRQHVRAARLRAARMASNAKESGFPLSRE
jgi:heme exporter protein D